jgi:hypothetical protein
MKPWLAIGTPDERSAPTLDWAAAAARDACVVPSGPLGNLGSQGRAEFVKSQGNPAALSVETGGCPSDSGPCGGAGLGPAYELTEIEQTTSVPPSGNG